MLVIGGLVRRARPDGRERRRPPGGGGRDRWHGAVARGRRASTCAPRSSSTSRRTTPRSARRTRHAIEASIARLDRRDSTSSAATPTTRTIVRITTLGRQRAEPARRRLAVRRRGRGPRRGRGSATPSSQAAPVLANLRTTSRSPSCARPRSRGAAVAAETVRAAVAKVALPTVDREITASIGLAVMPDDALDGETLVRDGRPLPVRRQVERPQPRRDAAGQAGRRGRLASRRVAGRVWSGGRLRAGRPALAFRPPGGSKRGAIRRAARLWLRRRGRRRCRRRARRWWWCRRCRRRARGRAAVVVAGLDGGGGAAVVVAGFEAVPPLSSPGSQAGPPLSSPGSTAAVPPLSSPGSRPRAAVVVAGLDGGGGPPLSSPGFRPVPPLSSPGSRPEPPLSSPG